MLNEVLLAAANLVRADGQNWVRRIQNKKENPKEPSEIEMPDPVNTLDVNNSHHSALKKNKEFINTRILKHHIQHADGLDMNAFMLQLQHENKKLHLLPYSTALSADFHIYPMNGSLAHSLSHVSQDSRKDPKPQLLFCSPFWAPTAHLTEEAVLMTHNAHTRKTQE